MQNHGTDPERRFARLRDHVVAMRAIWTQDEAEHRGPFVQFEQIWSWPKPAQSPHPPILIGGNGPGAEARVISYGDEWMPIPGEGLAARIAEFRARAEVSGRGALPVTVYGADRADVDEYAAAGAHRCVFWLPPRDSDAIREKVAGLARVFGY